MSNRYVFITGGVISSLGKGIAASSIGTLLESRNLKVNITKMDPYLNVDPGTMSPFQHGEVFVTEDGAETDLDLGHYERFIHRKMTKNNSFSAGQVYNTVINQERSVGFAGATVQVVPHITDEIKRRIILAAKDTDIAIVEVGGTVGDIESLPFIEAIRQIGLDFGFSNCIFIHLTLLPFLKPSGEIKTKPTSHSVKELLSNGIQPDILLCRCEVELSTEIKEKISLFTNVEPCAVISAHDAKSIYSIPRMFAEQNLDEIILNKLGLKCPDANIVDWIQVEQKILNPKQEVTIGMVGKYVNLTEAYKSLNEALLHSAITHDAKANIKYIDSDILTEDLSELKHCDAILVPGGFGERGIEGKILAVKYARENNIPLLGICLGMQLIIIEFARNVMHLSSANSTEFEANTEHPVIGLVSEWIDSSGKKELRTKYSKLGGTMRLGAQDIVIAKNSMLSNIYDTEYISERHRHRYEVNEKYCDLLEEKGLKICGRSRDLETVEAIELADLTWFIGVQFHPEFKSNPRHGHPLLNDYIRAALEAKYS